MRRRLGWGLVLAVPGRSGAACHRAAASGAAQVPPATVAAPACRRAPERSRTAPGRAARVRVALRRRADPRRAKPLARARGLGAAARRIAPPGPAERRIRYALR